MKVCILSHSFSPAQGAAELYLGKLARAIKELGVEVVVITPIINEKTPVFEEDDGLRIYRFPVNLPHKSLHYFSNFAFMFQLYPHLEKVYAKEKFDIIHSEHVFSIPAAGKFSKKHGLPHVAVIEGISSVSIYSKLIYLAHRLVLPRSNYDILVAWSGFLVEEFFRKWGIPESKMRVIPGAVDTSLFNPFIDSDGLKNGMVQKNEKLIFTAKPMNYTNFVGLSYIVGAMKYVLKEYPNCRLVVAGSGRMLDKLKNVAKKSGVEQKVTFKGWVKQTDLPKYYAAANIVVDSITYRHAGSVTLLESLASGKPNVLCNIESLPGENSFPTNDIAVLVDPKNEVAMAQGILKLLKDEELGNQVGMSGWEFIKDNFSMEIVAQRYPQLYREVLQSFKIV